MPIESNMVKPMVAEPVVSAPAASPAPANVDYTTRSKPLPANTAALRNDRSTVGSGKAERPARADRN